MNNYTLVTSQTSEVVIIGFRNSSGDVEYTTYTPADSGIIDSECTDLGGILADKLDVTEYEDYLLKGIQ